MKDQRIDRNLENGQNIGYLLALGLLLAVVGLSYAHAENEKNALIRSVGQVGDDVVTSRDIQISGLMEQALRNYSASPQGKKTPINTIPASGDLFDKNMSQGMLEWMLAKEASSFSIAEVSDEQLTTTREYLLKALSGQKAWEALQVPPLELDLFLKRKLQAGNFLKFKTQASSIAISDQDAQSYYEKNKRRFSGMDFNANKERIKSVIAEQRMKESMEEWFDMLKRKYRVRLLKKPFE